MTSSDPMPKLPTWIFYVLDAILLGTAWYIAQHASHPLNQATIFWIATCVLAGALVLLVPLVLHFERQKNETLDERQRALESLARTITTSAEQIGIAASGLHQIAEIAQKNLKHAEQLPHKLQEKIAEFQSALANASDAEKEELEKEVVALRSSESERLETAATKIARATAEFAKLEAATQQHLVAANDAIAKLSFAAAGAIGKAQAAAEQAFAQARTEAAKGVGEAAGAATRAIETAQAAALAELDARLAQASSGFAERVSRELVAKLQSVGGAPPAVPAVPATPTVPAESAAMPALETPAPDSPAHPPKRPRKPRREEDAPAEGAAAVAAEPPTKAITMDEPPPMPAEKISEVAPVAPHTAEPFTGHLADTPAPAGEPKPARRRAAKKNAEPVEAPKDEFQLDEAAAPTGGVGERGLTSDGATRLLVTAYIGIGNRLFIRGSGPGLSWDKGVPLQFVSIGKWRWESSDATGPIEFKLYKNDDTECTALGAQSLDPGYQQEVTASFG